MEAFRLIEVELPGEGFVQAEQTRGAPGAVLDGMRHRTRIGVHGLVFSSFAIVSGMGQPAIQALVAALDARYLPTKDLGPLPGVGHLLETHIPLSALRSDAFRFLFRFHERFPRPWIHCEDGRYLIRGEAPPGDEADDVVQRVEAYFVKRGVGSVRVMAPTVEERARFDLLSDLALGRRGLGSGPRVPA